MKRLFALLLALVMIFALVACGNNAADDTKANDQTNDTAKDTDTSNTGNDSADGEVKNTLNVAFSQDRGTLDPCYCIGYDVLNAVKLMYDPLWEWTSDGEQVWMLATGIDFISDSCWHIHIREGVKFSNGNPLTAEDVMFSIDKANHRTGEPDYLPYLESMRVVDDYTVELNFTQYDLSYIYSMTSLLIFDEESFDAEEIAQKPNGTGPYALDDYVVNSHISMSRKEDYWGEQPGMEYINFRIYTESSQITNAIVTGEIDVASVPLADIDYIQDSGMFKVELANGAYSMTRALYFNTTEYSKLYNNLKARQAIAMAIDTEAILELVYNGYGEVSVLPCSKQCIDADESLWNYGIYGTGYDPEGAKQLAEEAGIIGETFSISTNGTSDAMLTAELIQTDLEAIGVHVTINNYDTGSWLSYAFDPSQAGDMLVDFTSEPSNTICQGLSCWYLYALGGGFTTTPFEGGDRMTQLSTIAMSIADEKERAVNNREMLEFVCDNMLWYSLVDQVSANGYAVGLSNFRVFMAGNIDYRSLTWN